MAGTCEYGDEPSGSKNSGNFLARCRTSWLLKKDSAPWSKEVSKYVYLITVSNNEIIMPENCVMYSTPLYIYIIFPNLLTQLYQ